MSGQRHITHRNLRANPIVLRFFCGATFSASVGDDFLRQLDGYITGAFETLFTLARLVETFGRRPDLGRRFGGCLLLASALFRSALSFARLFFLGVSAGLIRFRLALIVFSVTRPVLILTRLL